MVDLLKMSSWCFMACARGGGGGGGGYSHISRLGPFLGVQNSEFQYFLGFSEK